MSERSKDLVRRINEKQEKKALTTKANLHAVEMREKAFDHEWKRLGQLLREISEELNQENAGVHLVVDDSLDQIIATRSGTKGSIKGVRSPVTHEYSFTGILPNGQSWGDKFWIYLTDDGLDWYLADVHSHRVTCEQIADMIISALAEA